MDSGAYRVKEGDTICVVGGGPGGAACAISLKREAARLGQTVRVVIYEEKRFDEDRRFNQCIGVLSPPIEDILLDKLGLELPARLIVREIEKYRLHSDRLSLDLAGDEDGKTYAVSRTGFDAFLLREARNLGVEVVHNQVVGLEVGPDEVLVYTDGENCRAAAIVGAFGLDEGAGRVFEHATPYRVPDYLNTIITRLYPGEDFLNRMGPVIQAFMLSFGGLEFGAITPKSDHISVNIAGRRVSSEVMLKFLRSAPVQRFLPPKQRAEKPLNYFTGRFPISQAAHLFGDRYVTIGDAAGLIRPFKGKGINSAILTGNFAARCILNAGVSRRAFKEVYMKDCEVFTQDLYYGKAMRLLANFSSRFGFMDRVLKMAGNDPVFMECMFNCVTAHKTYKEIIRETASLSLACKFVLEGFAHFILQRPAGPAPGGE